METYSLLREFADSWVLLLMTLFFISVIVWAFRPGSRKTHEDAADIPFRNDTIENGNSKNNDAGQRGAKSTIENEATS